MSDADSGTNVLTKWHHSTSYNFRYTPPDVAYDVSSIRQQMNAIALSRYALVEAACARVIRPSEEGFLPSVHSS